MIENEREYQITREQAASFERALGQLDTSQDVRSEVHPLLRDAERRALEAQLSQLRGALTEYEQLRDGKRIVLPVTSIADLGSVLHHARIASSRSFDDLAAQVSASPKQLRSWERDRYRSAPFRVVIALMDALGVIIRSDLSASMPVTPSGLEQLTSERQATQQQPPLVRAP